jgi:ferredoxin-NADP reductase
MTDHRVKLKNSEEVAEGTMAFHFEKPPGFEFKAGQFVRLTLLDPPETDAEGNARTFTLASAPSEEDLMVATRMRDSAFKRVLKSMPLGTAVELRGPFGALTLRDDESRLAVFLAGGIGVTPFRSMSIQAAKVGLRRRIFLFYSNRRHEDAAFLGELQELESKNSNYRFIPTLTRPEDSDQEWLGETGYINREMLGRYIGDLNSPIYYTAGPPAMVDAMEKLLAEAGVDGDNVRTERFKGY